MPSSPCFAPSVARAPYITAAGARALRAELQTLWRVTRPELTRRVSEAAALGDRSENAEYIYGKKALRELDRRVRYLSKRLDEVQVIDRFPDRSAGIRFGASVTLVQKDGTAQALRIVGYDEIDPQRHWISIDAPVARALLGKQVGDEVALPGANSQATLWIVEAFSYDRTDA